MIVLNHVEIYKKYIVFVDKGKVSCLYLLSVFHYFLLLHIELAL